MRGITVAFVAAATYAGASAKADVITFEGFFPATYVTQTMLYQAGYTLVYTPNDPFGLNGFPYGFAVIGDPPYSTACGPTPCSTNGTYAFYSFNTGSLTISATDGRPISISALDAAQTFTENNWKFRFHGDRAHRDRIHSQSGICDIARRRRCFSDISSSRRRLHRPCIRHDRRRRILADYSIRRGQHCCFRRRGR